MISILIALAMISVADGDTFTIDGERIRPVGFDAPELKRAKCVAERMMGLLAKRRFEELVRAPGLLIDRIKCKTQGPRCVDGIALDVYRRTLARVYVRVTKLSMGLVDLGPNPMVLLNVKDIMIKEGYARKYRQNFRGKWCK